MTITDTKPPNDPHGWLRRAWEKVATVLAVIGLADVFDQLIHWAKWVHEIATKYAMVRTWLFGRLPFYIPPEWHDPVVLFLIFFSVTNVGLYRRTGHTFVLYVYKNQNRVSIPLLSATATVLLVILGVSSLLGDGPAPGTSWLGYYLYYFGRLIGLFEWLLVLALIVLFVSAVVLAWRWVLSTAAIFGALVAINQVYVLWLEPLAH